MLKKAINLYTFRRNNRPTLLSVSKELQENGVIFTDIFTAAREHGELLQKYLMKDLCKGR